MTKVDLKEVLGKSLDNYQLKQLAEDGGNLESALTLIDRLESELMWAKEHIDNLEFLLKQKKEKISQLEAKAAAYDRLMSGNAKMTMQEMANFIGRPITISRDGGITAHGAMPRLETTQFGKFWHNEADDYMEINESFVDFSGSWQDSLTLPD